MNRRFWTPIIGATLLGSLMLGGSTAAFAFPIYEDADYAGYTYQATWAQKDGLGTMNAQASSMRAPAAGKTFYEGRGYVGRSVYLRGNVPRLTQIGTGLGWGQSWNDRIQSYR